MNAAIVIPARYQSTRFPGKPLAMIAGRSLIARVYERAAASLRADAVIVATDHQEIFDHVRELGGTVVMTDPELPSGTDRIAQAIERQDGDYTQIVNVQGDEPLIDVASIDRIIEELQSTEADIVTLASRIESEEDHRNRDIVKVVTDLHGMALYFSRAPIPWGAPHLAGRHIGVYGYQAAALRRFTTLPPTPLEQAESLEQLRALQNGFRIRVLPASRPHIGVDRPEDVSRVESELARFTE